MGAYVANSRRPLQTVERRASEADVRCDRHLLLLRSTKSAGC
jgi:hypothetical protein